MTTCILYFLVCAEFYYACGMTQSTTRRSGILENKFKSWITVFVVFNHQVKFEEPQEVSKILSSSGKVPNMILVCVVAVFCACKILRSSVVYLSMLSKLSNRH